MQNLLFQMTEKIIFKLPKNKKLDEVLVDISAGATRGTQFFEEVLKIAKTIGKVRQAFLGNSVFTDEKGSEHE